MDDIPDQRMDMKERLAMIEAFMKEARASTKKATAKTTATVKPPKFVQIVAGSYHSLALAEDGTVWAWGRNDFGQLGDGTTATRLTPVPVSSLTGVVAIADGFNHSLAVKSDGTIWAWGFNSFGQLGDGSTTDRLTPFQVSGLTGVAAIAGGAEHSLALKSDGTIWAWGNNDWGQLGDASTTDRLTPFQVKF